MHIPLASLTAAATGGSAGGGTAPGTTGTGCAGAGLGYLADGTPISPALARKLACDCDLIPAVLGTDGAVLDLGRTHRLFTGATRRALVLRDRGCAFPG